MIRLVVAALLAVVGRLAAVGLLAAGVAQVPVN
jgi:hypothetical protein